MYELKPPFIERMKILLPDEKDFQSYLKILKEQPVRSIRCNTLKISSSDLKKKLEEKGWKIKQPWKDYPEVMIVDGKIINKKIAENNNSDKNSDYVINNIMGGSERSELLGRSYWREKIKINNEPMTEIGDKRASASKLIDLEPGELGRSLEHLLGYYYIQELASMLPIIALKPEPNDIFLDLCASPGSKTTQAASTMQNTGTIIANEVSLGRIKILASNLERCGCINAILTRKDGIAFCQRIRKFNPNFKFDKILIDAPCSGEGTLRSSPKTYQMWNPKTIQNLSKLQKSMVASAIEMLKPKGILVYSTCTHAPEENEEVVNFILEKFPEMKIETIKLPIKCRQGITKWKDKEFSKEVNKSCRIYPQDENTEGFFIAKFKKK